MKIDLGRFLIPNYRLGNLHLFKTFEACRKESNVLKVDVTEVDKCGGVASAFKMKQPQGVSIHKLLQSNLKTSNEVQK